MHEGAAAGRTVGRQASLCGVRLGRPGLRRSSVCNVRARPRRLIAAWRAPGFPVGDRMTSTTRRAGVMGTGRPFARAAEVQGRGPVTNAAGWTRSGMTSIMQRCRANQAAFLLRALAPRLARDLHRRRRQAGLRWYHDAGLASRLCLTRSRHLGAPHAASQRAMLLLAYGEVCISLILQVQHHEQI